MAAAGLVWVPNCEERNAMSVAIQSFFDPAPGLRVSIALTQPKDFDGLRLSLAAPEWSWLRQYQEDRDWASYAVKYRARLEQRSARLQSEVQELVDCYDQVTFCCWCRDVAACHRRLFAEWLATSGWEVTVA